jgi:hypothetical protein
VLEAVGCVVRNNEPLRRAVGEKISPGGVGEDDLDDTCPGIPFDLVIGSVEGPVEIEAGSARTEPNDWTDADDEKNSWSRGGMSRNGGDCCCRRRLGVRECACG